MAFLDSVSAFTKGVGAKAKGSLDVMNLNSQISSSEKELNNLFKELGEKYFESHLSDPDDVYSGLIESIKNKKIDIERLKEDAEKIKAETAAVQLTAPEDHKTVNQPVPAPGMVPFPQPYAAPRPAVTPQPSITPDTQDQVTVTDTRRFCPECGSELDDDSIFCGVCGTKIE